MENNYESSKKLLEEVIAFYPEKSILLVDLGLVELEAGNKERALALIQKAYDSNRYDMWATFQLARVWMQFENSENAERLLKEVQGEMPNYSKVYFELGKLAAAKGEKGNSAFFLGKYNLYEGRLKLALHNFKTATNDPGLDKEHTSEIKKMQETIKRLKDNK